MMIKNKKKGGIFPKNHRGWIRIVEAFVAILLVAGVLLIVINKGDLGKKDISLQIYKVEFSILREIQLNSELRNSVLEAGDSPIKWDDENFPLNVKNKIVNRLPNYLNCEAKICEIEDVCVLDTEFDKDIYVQSVIITTTLETYNPRQLKLFCWVGVPSEPEPVPEKPEAIIELKFSGTEYELKHNVEIDGQVYSDVHYYYHTRTFEESNGVGVSLTEGQLCYKDETCDPKGNVNYRIEADGELIHTGKKFWTGYNEDSFTLKYWGIDDNGYDVYVEQSMCVNEEDFVENCEV